MPEELKVKQLTVWEKLRTTLTAAEFEAFETALDEEFSTANNAATSTIIKRNKEIMNLERKVSDAKFDLREESERAEKYRRKALAAQKAYESWWVTGGRALYILYYLAGAGVWLGYVFRFKNEIGNHYGMIVGHTILAYVFALVIEAMMSVTVKDQLINE